MTVRPRTEPAYYVKVAQEGAGAERVDLSERVLAFAFEDSEKKADKLVLTVDNWDLKNFDDPVWKKGNLLEVSWGYPGEMAPAREVVIQKVTGFQTLNVEGHAKSVLMNKVARCRTFENQKRSDVVRQIASDGQVTVLHQGTVLCEGKFDEVQADRKVREVYLGRGKHGTR